MNDLLRLSIRGEIDAKTRLALLKLDPTKRRRLLNRLAVRKLRPFFRGHVKAQTSPTGVAYPKRKHRKPKQKAKMLTGLAKKIVVTKLTDTKVVLGWSNGRNAMIASVHNSGATLKGSKRDMTKISEKMKDQPATKEQAKTLRRLGYKIRKKGSKTYRTASLKQILESLTFNQAGVMIKVLKAEQTKQNWDIPVPKREFIGVNPTDINILLNDLIPQVINSPTGATT